MTGQNFLTGNQLGDPEVILDGNFEKASCWDNHKDFRWETGKVKWSVIRMEVWLGGANEDVTRATKCI